ARSREPRAAARAGEARRMNVVRSAAAALAVMALLAGCVSAPVRVPAQVDPAVAGHADARRASLEAWGLAGRVAISGGRQGGSGRLDWVQQGGRYEVTLSAPVTRQGWRLSGDAGRARLEGVEGGPREGADVEALLLEATGWDIPGGRSATGTGSRLAPTGRRCRAGSRPAGAMRGCGWWWTTGPSRPPPRKMRRRPRTGGTRTAPSTEAEDGRARTRRRLDPLAGPSQAQPVPADPAPPRGRLPRAADRVPAPGLGRYGPHPPAPGSSDPPGRGVGRRRGGGRRSPGQGRTTAAIGSERRA